MSLPRGTIVYGMDPFKDADSGRPWLIINTPEMPFHGEQYIALSLSTRTWYDERLPLDADDLLEGGLPRESAVLPWAVASRSPSGIDRELGRTTEDVVNEAVATLGSYLGIVPEER